MEWITVRGEDGRPTSYGWPDEESVGTGDCSCSTEAGEEEAEAAAKWKKEEEEERTGHVWLPDLHEVLPCPAPSNNESRGQQNRTYLVCVCGLALPFLLPLSVWIMAVAINK